MKRGMFSFTQKQLKTLLSSFTAAPLTQKLSAAQQAETETTIELSEDELEQLLDALPMPTNENKETLTELRQHLYAALSALRAS